jgi:hypothetical protein
MRIGGTKRLRMCVSGTLRRYNIIPLRQGLSNDNTLWPDSHFNNNLGNTVAIAYRYTEPKVGCRVGIEHMWVGALIPELRKILTEPRCLLLGYAASS